MTMINKKTTKTAVDPALREAQQAAHAALNGSHPLARVSSYHLQPFWTEAARESERWIEVYVGDDNIDVITRRCDDITNVIAEGFAKLCARHWQGRLEQG
jgi:hypothetical protein